MAEWGKQIPHRASIALAWHEDVLCPGIPGVEFQPRATDLVDCQVRLFGGSSGMAATVPSPA